MGRDWSRAGGLAGGERWGSVCTGVCGCGGGGVEGRFEREAEVGWWCLGARSLSERSVRRAERGTGLGYETTCVEDLHRDGPISSMTTWDKPIHSLAINET